MVKRITILAWLLPAALACAGERVTLAAEDDWYPYSAARQGRAEGMAVDIVRAAYQAVDVEARFVTMPYARCMRLVRVGKLVGCFDTLKDVSTEPFYRFGLQPLFHATIAIYARGTQPPPHALTVADLAGKRVGLTNGYTYGSEVELDQRMRKERADSDLANLQKLARGRLDYALVYTRITDYLLATHPRELLGRIVRVGTVIENPLYLSFSKSHLRAPSAQQQLDRGLSLIRSDGRYDAIVKRWQRVGDSER